MEQPFTIEEIRKYPYAVVIALLIAMLTLFASVIGVLWYRDNTADERCDQRIEEKNQQIITMQQQRIQALEDRDYYKSRMEEQIIQDSIVKQKTATYVDKIFNRHSR